MGVKTKHPMEPFTPQEYKLTKKGFHAKEKSTRKELGLFMVKPKAPPHSLYLDPICNCFCRIQGPLALGKYIDTSLLHN